MSQMTVKILVPRFGHRFDPKSGRLLGAFANKIGDEVALPADEAQRLIESGKAAPVQQTSPRRS